jgi:hypothetical protein
MDDSFIFLLKLFFSDLAGPQRSVTWQVRSGNLILQTFKANLPGRSLQVIMTFTVPIPQ